ncbi:hypothetical protein LTR66_007342 [Elasticomyces elasticus]|nr:hypothetical protein LTR66_007342 [Elasticomyces elasticus]
MASTARLASPIRGTPPTRQIPTPRELAGADISPGRTPLAGASSARSSLPGPGSSSLTNALQQSLGRSPPRFATPPRPPLSPDDSRNQSVLGGTPRSNYGSFGPNSSQTELGRSPREDLDAVRRHLVLSSDSPASSNLQSQLDRAGSPRRPGRRKRGVIGGEEVEELAGPSVDDDEFSSLQLQGGDTTRHIYRYAEGKAREQAEAEGRETGLLRRSQSINLPRASEGDAGIHNIKMPGGFRRDHLLRTAESPAPSGRVSARPDMAGRAFTEPAARQQPQFVANNFIEFLTLYGHFAGESLDEDDEVLEPDEYFSSDINEDGTTDGEDRGGEREWGEDSALLTPGKRKRRRKERAGKGGVGGAALLLLKSFVGTGVLFLPRAFLNGGMLFSNLVLLFIALLSFWCFILLVNTRLKVPTSFGDMGGQLYGWPVKALINFSLVISQIGFASAYIVFVSENLQAFIMAVSQCRTFIDIKYMILMQMVVFLPLSLYRNINNIQKLALVADAFICLGLIYLYYYDIYTIASQHGVADIVNFNKDSWTLFIGTAIFTFEGIGLIIPIQSGMKDPTKFPRVLGAVMVVISVIFISMGALSYAAYGSSTKTVIILNMPQDNKMVNGVQFIYSLAILLSTPLQIYPAIEITSQQLFSRTGKYNPWIKWKKNVFRFFMVMLCAGIAWLGANDLDKFVALVGSFACIPLVYIYPPLLHYRAVSTKTWQRTADVLLCVFGFVVMGYTTALTIVSWAGGNSAAKSPGYCDDR